MIKIQNDSLYDKDVYDINTNNITYIEESHVDYDGNLNRKTHILYIFFMGKKDYLELKTYNEDKFNEWLKLLGV
jgi:hypothetical protein